MDRQSRNTLLHVSLATLSLFLVGRFLGMGPLSDTWSFSHWHIAPWWHAILWPVVLAGAIGAFTKLSSWPFAGRTASLIILLILPISLLVFWYFRSDVFVYGGGNLRIAQIAYAEVVFPRWFEYGTVLFVSWIHSLFLSPEMTDIYAAANAWRSLGLISAAVAGLGAFRLAVLLSDQQHSRVLLFILIFLGGQALLYFGFIGVEVVIAPIAIWFAVVAAALWKHRSATSLLLLWLVTGLGVLLLFQLVILVPAAVYFTFATLRKHDDQRISLLAGIFTLVVLVAGIYWEASQSFAMQVHLLFLDGKMPFSDYGLFSARHASEWLQFLFLGAPLLIAVIGATIVGRYDVRSKALINGLWLVLLGGLVASFVLDPAYGMVADLPRFAAYLSPVTILLAALTALPQRSGQASPFPLAICAALALVVPLSVLHPYRDILAAEVYTQPTFKNHDSYYRTAAVAFRDSYSYLRDREEVNRWDRLLPVYSPDQLNLRGTDYLAQNDDYENALTVQYRIIAKFPYWAEPRGMAAANQLKLGRLQLAKPQLDTALILEPFRKELWANLYVYYRDMQNYPEAIRAITRAEELAPSDVNIQTDKMIITYRIGRLAAADSLADALLARDSLAPFPYLIKAFVADRSQNPRGAVFYYEKFVKLGPNEPEAPRAQARLDALKIALDIR